MKDYLKNPFAARGAAFWLNLLGLSLAFVIFYVLVAEVMWHVTFDRFHKDADRVCQVYHKNILLEKTRWGSYHKKYQNEHGEIGTCAASFAENISKYTQDIEASVLISYPEHKYWLASVGAEKDSIQASFITYRGNLFDVFTFDFVEGNSEGGNNSGNLFLPLSLAKKLYGEKGPYIGRECTVNSGKVKFVAGVYRDFPTNSQMGNSVYESMSEAVWQNLVSLEWINNWWHKLFVKLREGVDGEDVSNRLIDSSPSIRETTEHFTFIPLPDLFYTNENEETDAAFEKRAGNRIVVMYLAQIALFVILMAAINYINFSIAKAPAQIKEMNIRRILGEKVWNIRFRLLGQAFFNILMAMLLAWGVLIVIIRNGFMNDWLKCELDFSNNASVLWMLVVLVVLIPIVAGGYPAWYITSRKPALVINGGYALSPAGKTFRKTLIGFQFSVSLVAIMMMLLVSGQNHYMRTTPVGYARDSIIYVTGKTDLKDYQVPLTETLKVHSSIKDVSWSQFRLGEDKNTMSVISNNAFIVSFPVSHDFFTTMGIKITEGRNFRPEDNNVHILNETARKKCNLELNGDFFFGEIIGFCEDVKYGSLKNKVGPVAFSLNHEGGNQCAIRLTSPDRKAEAISYVNEVFAKVSEGAFEWEVSTSKDIADVTYAKEMRLLKLLMLVSIISLAIPLIGIFGLVLFETRARRKEIGVRKVFGATTRGILVMFNWQYIRILIVCFIFAAPVAYSLYERWIESFAYRTPMHWWLFGVAFLIVAIVICLTVTVQSWRAAKERPVETIMK